MNEFFLRAGTLLAAVLLFIAVPATAEEISGELQKVRDTVSDRFAEIRPE